MANWCRMVKPNVGSSIPRQMDLGCVGNVESRKGKETNKQHSSVACASVPVSRFEPWALSLDSLDDGLLAARWKKHFYSMPPLLMMFITATGKQTRTVPMLNPSLHVLISLCVLSATLLWNAITSLRKYLSNHSIKQTLPTAWIRRSSIVIFEFFATSSMGYKWS